MKFSIFIFLSFLTCLPAFEIEPWAERVSRLSPHAIFEYAKSIDKQSEKLVEFAKSKEIAGPFLFPVNDISAIQGNKVKTSEEELPFLDIKTRAKNKNKSKSNTAYYVVRFTTELESSSNAIVKVHGGGQYRIFLNGRYLDQKLNGLTYEKGSTNYFVKMKKGKNEFIILPTKAKSVNSGISFVTVSKEVQEKYKAFLIEKYSVLNDENRDEYLLVLDRICESDDTRIISDGVARVINEFALKEKDGLYLNVMRKALTDKVFMAVRRKVDLDKLALIMVQADLSNMVRRLSDLILNEKGKYVEEFLFKALSLCTTDHMKQSFRSNLYEAAKMFMYCGRYGSANRILGKYRTIMNVKDEHHFKTVEALFIETSDPGKVKPRFVGDPETDHLKREVDTLLAEKPGKEAFQRLLRLFRNKGHQLFEDSDRKLSLRGYLAGALKSKKVYAKGFATYLKGRYQEDVNHSIATLQVKDLEKTLSEVEGLTQFPEARKFLMQEFYNRGEIRKALRDASFLIKYGHEESLAAAYILILEDRLSIPQNSRVQLPEKVLSTSVKLAGKSVQISNLVSKYRTKTFKTSPKGPGKLISQFELAEVSYGSFESYDSDKKTGTLKLNRQPLTSNYYQGKWISASPYGIKVFDKSGKALWNIKKPIKEATTQEAVVPKIYQTKIVENTLYNLEYAEGSQHLELIARDLSGNEIWSTQTLKGYEKWEPCSLPYSKFNTAVILLMEKQRTTSPVIGIGFIDLETGNLSKIIPISRTRDPFSRDRRYTDISNIARFHDRFTSDEASIYFYTGSGQVIKINALEENISWVTGYHYRLAGTKYHFSMSLNRATSAAPGFIAKNGNKIINFNPARVGWFIIDDADGSVEWKNFTQIPNYIHSRGTSEVIFSTGSEERRNLLVRMNPQTGKRIWTKDLLGIRVTGEGVYSNNKIYIPTVKGIAEFDAEKGNFLKISPLKETPIKIDRIDDMWLVQSRFNGFVFDSGDKLTSNIKEVQKGQAVHAVQMNKTDARFWALETAVEFPFNFSKKDRDEIREIFKTSKPGHYIIRIGNDVALFRESTYENKQYTPPKVVWSNSINDFEVIGDNLLIRYEDRIEVFNVLSRRNSFVYESDQQMSGIFSEMNHISMARMHNNKVFILTAKQELLQYDVSSGKLLHKYRLNATDFALEDNKLLAFLGSSGKYKTSLYEVNGSLKLIKEFDEKISNPHLAQSNSKYFACFSKDSLYVLNKATNEFHKYNCSGKTGWRLIGDFAAVAPKVFINLKSKQQKKTKGVYLCESGGAIVIENKDDVLYLSEKGQTKLQNINDEFYFPNQDPINRIRDFGRGADYNDQLVLTSFEGERIYSKKDGKLLATRTWAHGERNTEFLFTEKSRLVMKADKAFVFSNLGLELPVSRLTESSEDIQKVSWVKLNSNTWINVNKSSALDAYYRYSETSENVTVQVKIKGALREVNGLAISINGQRTQDYVFAEAVEGRSTFINVSDHLVTDERKNHYYDDNGYEYLEINLEKDQLVNYSSEPSVQIEIASFKNTEKIGFYRIGSSFAPGAFYLNLNGESSVQNFTENRFKELEELYTSAACLMADGTSLSSFITHRRTTKGVDDNMRFLEAMLKKHKGNVSAISILTSLFLEKAHKLKVSGKVSDASLLAISKECRSLANSIKMNKGWIDYGLTIFDLEIFNDKNHRAMPYQVGLKGEGAVFLPLDGSIQISASDGRVLLAPGLFNRSYPYKIKELEFRMGEFSTLFGEFKLLRDDKFTQIANSKGEPNSEMTQDRWKDAVKKTLAFSKSGPTEAYSLSSRNSRLYIKDLELPRFEQVYNWDGDSLLSNMKLNPVSEWQATDMLRKWLEINKVSDDKLKDILVEVMSYNPDNYNLIYSVSKILLEKTKDLELIKKVLRKSKIQINFRRRIFLEFSNMDAWQQLGPLYSAEDIENPKFKPSPEKSRLNTVKDFTDSNGNKFQFKPYVSNKNRKDGLVYFKTEFESKNAAKAYLHLSNHGDQGYGQMTVWLNGKKVSESTFSKWKLNQDSTLLECREGKNTILIKYSFVKNKKIRITIGDLYGAPVSYIK